MGSLTQAGHLLPLSCPDGLLDGMDAESGQASEFVHGLVGREGPVGIHTQLDAVAAVSVAQTTNQGHFIVKIDGSYLDFHTREALIEFQFQAPTHRVKIAHPHQAVDGNAFLATGKRRVGQGCRASTVELVPCRLESEKHRRTVAQGIDINTATGAHIVAMMTQHRVIVGQVVTTEMRQRCAFPHPDDARQVIAREVDKAAHTRGVNTARSARRLLEMKRAGGDVDMVAAHGYQGK